GEYELSASMAPLEILDHLVKGQVKRHLVTIPEGFTAVQIAQLLDDVAGARPFIGSDFQDPFRRFLGNEIVPNSSLTLKPVLSEYFFSHYLTL
ncbi:MAG: endolytic transglycosylase MltG, partial [Bryobacteraceae bacterium]|nr:endolytic transglycosylase MltG [Bryobacteraceae bacterium]